MFTTAFLRDLAERVAATFCQALAALLIADGTGLLDTTWVTTLSAAGMTALIALLKGIAARGIDSETGASLLTSPPPKVDERGVTDSGLIAVVLTVVTVVLLLALIGALPVR